MSVAMTGAPKIVLSSAKVKTWHGETAEMVPEVCEGGALGEALVGAPVLGAAEVAGPVLGPADVGAAEVAGPVGASLDSGAELGPVDPLGADEPALGGALADPEPLGWSMPPPLGPDEGAELLLVPPTKLAVPLTVFAQPTTRTPAVSTPATSAVRRNLVISPS